MKIKSFILPAILLLMLTLLAACGGTEAPETTAPESTAEPAPSELVLFDSGEFKFEIVRPEHAEEGILSAAVALREELVKLSGCDIIIKDDYIKKGQEHDPSTYEILVGDTGYAESAELYEGITYGMYRIAARGNKIVLAAADGASITKAVYSLVLDIEDGIKSGRAVIPSDYTAEQKVSSVLASVPAFGFGTFFESYSGSHDDKSFIYRSTSPEELKTYTELLTDAGCELYSSSEHGNNLAATLTNDKAVINLFYTAADKKTRVIIDNAKTTAYPLKEQSYGKVCSSLLVQLGLEPSDSNYFASSAPSYSNGMGYIYRLHDGSFIIIDGGFNTADNATLIYDTLCELAPDKNNIVIAAWIITHQHVDHIGAMDTFTSMYASKVKLELAIYNFPTTAECGTIINGNPYNADRFYQYIKNYPGVKSIIAHPGQYYNIRNAKIEMLHTLDLMRGDVTMADSNSVCLMFRIEIEGQTHLFPGDSYQDMTAVLVKNYGSYLKSDFVQVIHHGGNGGSNAFYKAVDPAIVLWPAGHYYFYPHFIDKDYHSYLFESANVKEIILAGNTDRTIELPYTYPTELIMPPRVAVS